jgi:hypothetical protein
MMDGLAIGLEPWQHRSPVMDKKNEKKKYSTPRVTRIKLEDKRGVGMGTPCRVLGDLADTNCYQDYVTPISTLAPVGGGS